ncbi:helix-turn-helix domain-containing protein [Streptomyces sp. NPDC002540]
MSIKVTNWVWARSESRNGARLVMLALADRADDNGFCWPSIDDLAERTRLSPRAVQKGIATLVKNGELNVENGGGRHRSNRYRIIPKPCTSDGVTDQEPRTSDGVSPEETPNFEAETPNSATETPHFAPRNPVQSSPEPPVEPSREPSENPPARELEPQGVSEQMFTKWWEQYGRTTAQGRSTIRRSISDALRNGLEPSVLWQALERLGDLSKPVTGGTLQFALSEIRQQDALPASVDGTNVVSLAAARRPSTTDARVQQALEAGRRLQAIHDAQTQENQ